MSKMILLVEDEAGFRRIYRDILSNAGYAVLEAEDGMTGLSMAQDHHPDLILLDLVMPNLDGLQVLQVLRRDPDTQNIPVIIFSVLGDEARARQGLELGASDILTKGRAKPQEILDKIKAKLSD